MKKVYCMTLEDTYGPHGIRQVRYRNILGEMKTVPIDDIWYFEKEKEHFIRIHHNHGVGVIRSYTTHIENYFEGILIGISKRHVVNPKYVEKIVLTSRIERRYEVYLSTSSTVLLTTKRRAKFIRERLRELGQHHKVFNQTEKKRERIKSLKKIFIEDDPQEQIIRVSNFTGIYEIPLNDILYISYNKKTKYTEIHTKSSGIFNSKESLTDIEYQLGGRGVVRIHRGCLVNRAYITHISVRRDASYNKFYYAHVECVAGEIRKLPIAMTKTKESLKKIGEIEITPINF